MRSNAPAGTSIVEGVASSAAERGMASWRAAAKGSEKCGTAGCRRRHRRGRHPSLHGCTVPPVVAGSASATAVATATRQRRPRSPPPPPPPPQLAARHGPAGGLAATPAAAANGRGGVAKAARRRAVGPVAAAMGGPPTQAARCHAGQPAWRPLTPPPPPAPPCHLPRASNRSHNQAVGRVLRRAGALRCVRVAVAARLCAPETVCRASRLF